MTGALAPLRPVDKSNPLPLYHQAEELIAEAVRSGRYPSGSLLESEHDLARILGISRVTLRRALESLVDKGVLARERGVGTRVLAQPRLRRTMVTRLTSLREDLVQEGVVPTTRILRLEQVPCPEPSAPHLGVEPGTPALLLERLRLVDEVPIALMWNLFPAGRLVLDADELAARSLYELMREQGTEARVANQTISAELPTAEQARLLDIPAASPVLLLERISYDGVGDCVEHGMTRYPASRYTFPMRLVGS